MPGVNLLVSGDNATGSGMDALMNAKANQAELDMRLQQAKSGIGDFGATMTLARGKPEFHWIEPKDSLMATIFPSDNTWHPLCDADKIELTENLFNLDEDPRYEGDLEAFYGKKN
jgi:hypothetical protein